MDGTLKNRLLHKLQEINQKKLSSFHITLLPDFFVDHFVSFPDYEQSMKHMHKIYEQGGGNLPGFSQWIHQGGNATNTALALSRLGISAHLICRTDPFGYHLLTYFLGKNGVDLSGVKTDGKIAITTALEFGKRHQNVMLGDPGSVADFSFDSLDDHDLKMISSSDIVYIGNWNLNLCGTDLVRKTISYAHKHHVKTFFDSGDPSPRKKEILQLMKEVLTNPQLDIFGFNENELHYFSHITSTSQKEIVAAALQLKKKMSARLDLHTSTFACTISTACTVIPALKLPRLYRATGAGDTWNAGNLLAELLGFEDDERLLFANTLTGIYLSSPQPQHPTIQNVIHSIKKSK